MHMTNAHHSDMLELKVTFLAKIIRCLGFFNDDHVFDANAEAAISVVPRFYCRVSCRLYNYS
jgi:hypothetical protein